ncbi:TetR/AcrR family transcriptional regulator [Halomarina rubra]|uniref:TetR/AcrR family transcriptional regulator n=1 Tax=Halomarina rubra TaxID=2071873 RepID=A0ABD6AYT7_9EURY|nr:TetR/AcrR family transcriptional regulator [Halomarina rubra]
MRATFRALRNGGYANLTVQRIADEYGKSTAAVHYHYDTKDELLMAFLDYLVELYMDEINRIETTDPVRRLEILLDKLLVDPQDHPYLQSALLEMRSQTPHKPAFRDRFERNDEYIRFTIKAVVNHGIDEGVFSDTDATEVTNSLMTIIDGGRTRSVVFDDTEELAIARRTATRYIQEVVIDGSSERPTDS